MQEGTSGSLAMTSRILAAVVVGVFAVGLATETRAQQGTANRPQAAKGVSRRQLRGHRLRQGLRAARSHGHGRRSRPVRFGGGEVEGFRETGKQFERQGRIRQRFEENDAPAKLEKATFGAGCFWHVEAAFEWLPGVKSAVSGYSGGSVPYPDYELVHSGFTGHAEVVQVTYDPSVISYEQLLKVFWSHHDPTQLNRQGPDFGTQYRSVIFYHTPAQREAALKSYRD